MKLIDKSGLLSEVERDMVLDQIDHRLGHDGEAARLHPEVEDGVVVFLCEVASAPEHNLLDVALAPTLPKRRVPPTLELRGLL